jgi:hypothetical protein
VDLGRAAIHSCGSSLNMAGRTEGSGAAGEEEEEHTGAAEEGRHQQKAGERGSCCDEEEEEEEEEENPDTLEFDQRAAAVAAASEAFPICSIPHHEVIGVGADINTAATTELDDILLGFLSDSHWLGGIPNPDGGAQHQSLIKDDGISEKHIGIVGSGGGVGGELGPRKLEEDFEQDTEEAGPYYLDHSIATNYNLSLKKQAESLVPVTVSPNTASLLAKAAASTLHGEGARGRNRKRKRTAADEEELRLKRRARNREAARKSRLRKKQHLEGAQEKQRELVKQVRYKRMKMLDSASWALATIREKFLEEVKQRLQPVESSVLTVLLPHELTQFGPNCKEQQLLMRFLFDQLAKLLLPGFGCFLLWLLTIAEKDLTASASDWQHQSDVLWERLCAEADLSQYQQKDIQLHLTEKLKESAVRAVLCSVVELIQELRSAEVVLTHLMKHCEHGLVDTGPAPPDAPRALEMVSRLQVKHANADKNFASNAAYVMDTALRLAAHQGENQHRPNPGAAETEGLIALLQKPNDELTLCEASWLLEWAQGARARAPARTATDQQHTRFVVEGTITSATTTTNKKLVAVAGGLPSTPAAAAAAAAAASTRIAQVPLFRL